MMMRILYALTLFVFVGSYQTFAQEQSVDLYELTLEELMNVPIQSASKKEETLFDAPLSSYTITSSEIEKSGSTSIMEALKLSPGVIVREESNGVYDIHIRGLENLTRTNGTFLKANTYTLVMIDNRPVFNHGLGGTFWESLPVDINDVERIEIVRGPSSSLFGPNAVTGVINIITKRMGGAKSIVNTNIQAGTSGTSIANISLGRTFSNKFSTIVTANFQDRLRFDEVYYKDSTGTYAPLSQLIPNADMRNKRYPHPSRSLNRWGVNGYFTYKASDKISIDLSLSKQEATSQRLFTTNPLQYANTNNLAANLGLKIHALKIRTSYVDGYNSDIQYNVPHGVYDFQVGDIMGEYDIKLGSNYTVTPGISYQSVKFEDAKYNDPAKGLFTYFNANVSINTTAAYIRSDLNFTKKLRALAALRVDKFSVPDKTYLAYEFSSTYKLNSKNLIRAAVTRSNSGSFIGYNFLDINIPGFTRTQGNTNLKLFTLSMIEVGYRSQIGKNFQLDLDLFSQKGKNLSAITVTSFVPTASQFRNTPTTATQLGATFSINYVPNDKIQFKPFVTLQKTETEDLPLATGFPTNYIDPQLAPVTYTNSTHKYTPGYYGGFYLNYAPVSKFNVNLSSYFFGKQSQYDGSWNENNPAKAKQTAEGQIKSKFMLSAKISYEVLKGLNVFVSGRNLIGASSREFYAADKTAGLYLVGASFNLK